MNSHSARAWKLPAFAVFYILASYLAAGMSHHLLMLYPPTWQSPEWQTALYMEYTGWLSPVYMEYTFMWFSDYALLSVPAWMLFHGGLLFTGMRYYRSGLSGWGWGLALFTLLCSTVGGIGVSALFLMLEIHGY